MIFTVDKKKNYYVQCAGSKSSTTVVCEAVSNEYLEPTWRLSETQIGRLLSLGWKSPNSKEPQGHPNFHREWEAMSDADRLRVANVLMDTLEVYGFSRSQKLDIDLGLE